MRHPVLGAVAALLVVLSWSPLSARALGVVPAGPDAGEGVIGVPGAALDLSSLGLRPLPAKSSPPREVRTAAAVLHGHVFFDDRPMSETVRDVPHVWVRNNETDEPYSDWTGWYDADTGEFQLENLPEASVFILFSFHVRSGVSSLPGNLRGSRTVDISALSEEERGDFRMDVWRILGLREPEDTSTGVLYTPILEDVPMLTSPVHLRWDEAAESRECRVDLYRVRSREHPEGEGSEQIGSVDVEGSEVDLELDATPPHERYVAVVRCFGDSGKVVGAVMTTYLGDVGWDYRFGVGVLRPDQIAAPTGLEADAISESQVQLRWSDESDDEIAFRPVVVSTGGGVRYGAPAAGDETSMVVEGLEPQQEYTFRIRAEGRTWLSGYSDEATARTPWGHCAEGDATLCLNEHRFEVEVRWRDFEGRTGVGHALPLTPDTGYFWFFNPNNIELVLKVLDGRPINGHYWVLYGALSNVEYEITVTDVGTGAGKSYHNPSGDFASQGDTEAIAGGTEKITAAPSGSPGGRFALRRMVVDRTAFLAGAEDSPEVPRESAEALEFSWSPSQPIVGTVVTFSDNQEEGVQRTWEFDDGTAPVGTTSSTTSHTFDEAGSYEVSLQVTIQGPLGSQLMTDVRQVSVGSGGAATILVAGPSQGAVDTPLTFSATASGCTPAPSGWSWTASGGGVIQGAGTQSSASIVWSTAGSKTVTATNSACSGASGGRSVVIEASSAGCSLQVTPGELLFPGSGGTGTVAVTTPSGCQWQASTDSSWITIGSGTSGSGSGTVSLAVAANSGAAREGLITVTGDGGSGPVEVDVSVFQEEESPECEFELEPASLTFDPGGGDGELVVSTSAGCQWRAATSAEWIVLTSDSGTGSGTVRLSVEANAGDARSARIKVGPASASVTQEGVTQGEPSCVPGPGVLCLGGNRFQVTVRWRDFADRTGPGFAVPLTKDTGFFWFFKETNVEIILKVLDGRGLNGHYWVFYGALSNVEYTIEVLDTVTGAGKTYANPLGSFASVGDTSALPGGGG